MEFEREKASNQQTMRSVGSKKQLRKPLEPALPKLPNRQPQAYHSRYSHGLCSSSLPPSTFTWQRPGIVLDEGLLCLNKTTADSGYLSKSGAHAKTRRCRFELKPSPSQSAWLEAVHSLRLPENDAHMQRTLTMPPLSDLSPLSVPAMRGGINQGTLNTLHNPDLIPPWSAPHGASIAAAPLPVPSYTAVPIPLQRKSHTRSLPELRKGSMAEATDPQRCDNIHPAERKRWPRTHTDDHSTCACDGAALTKLGAWTRTVGGAVPDSEAKFRQERAETDWMPALEPQVQSSGPARH
eukprot:1353959-Pleurochrysis_carterae.AAC.4